jgi:hypothetical protein
MIHLLNEKKRSKNRTDENISNKKKIGLYVSHAYIGVYVYMKEKEQNKISNANLY